MDPTPTDPNHTTARIHRQTEPVVVIDNNNIDDTDP